MDKKKPIRIVEKSQEDLTDLLLAHKDPNEYSVVESMIMGMQPLGLAKSLIIDQKSSHNQALQKALPVPPVLRYLCKTEDIKKEFKKNEDSESNGVNEELNINEILTQFPVATD